MTPPIEPGRSTSLEHLPVLDGLRGVAVAIVVAYHAHWLTGGYLGVDVFFVLSGFLITRLLLAEHERTGRIDLRHFWSRRARRLVPALVLVVVVAAIGERLRGRVDGPAGGRIDVIGALTYSTNWLRLRSGAGYWSAFGGPSLLDHTWSLAIEEQFYVLWPLVVVGIVRFVRRPGARVVVLATSTALAGAWSIVVFSHSFDASRVYMGTDTRAVALVAGATVAALVAWHGPLRSLVVKGLAFASAAVLVDMFVNLSGTEVRTYRGGLLMCSLATALVIAATATACPPLLARPLALPALRYLGERSYGIYLWHWPIMVALGVAKAPLSPSWRRLSAIAITLIVAEISYRVVERPIRRHGLAAFGPRWRPLLGGGVATTVALGAIALPVPVRPAASAIVLTTITAPSGPRPTATSAPRTAASSSSDLRTPTSSASTSAGLSTVARSSTSSTSPTSTVSRASSVSPSASPTIDCPSAPGSARTDCAALDPIEPPPGRAARVLFVGDSVGWFLAIQASEDAARLGIEVTNGAEPACPLTHRPLRRRARAGIVPLVFEQRCQDSVNAYRQLVAHVQPDIVVVAFGPTLLDENEIAPGHWSAPCSPDFGRWYEDEIRTAVADLGSTGAPVYWATQAYYRADITTHTPVVDGQIDCENATAAQVAAAVAANGAFGVVRLGEWACPSRQCVGERDGIELRKDGTHFKDAAATLANIFVLSQIFSPPPWQR